MAHLAKYTMAATGHLTAHYERRKDQNGLYIKFNNQNIDLSRTPQNYNLVPHRDLSQVEFIRQRCGKVQCMNRRDVNVMCDWVVTVPAGLPKKDHERFFLGVYDFLTRRYGSENAISAYVHMDEVSPHMHYAFIPLVYDKRKQRFKVSAKELISRKELKAFHPDLELHLSRVFGYEIGILNDATREGNKSIEELKRKSAIERLQEIDDLAQQVYDNANETMRQADEKFQEYEAQSQELIKKNLELSDQLERLRRGLQEGLQLRESLLSEIKRLEQQRKEVQDKLKMSQEFLSARELSLRQVQEIQPQKTITGALRDITIEDVESLKKMASQYGVAVLKYQELRGKYEELGLAYERVQRQVPSMEEQMEASRDQAELRRLRQVIGRLPDELRQEILRPEPKNLRRARDDWQIGD